MNGRDIWKVLTVNIRFVAYLENIPCQESQFLEKDHSFRYLLLELNKRDREDETLSSRQDTFSRVPDHL